MEKYRISLLYGVILLLTACGGGDKQTSTPACTANQYSENNVCKDKSKQNITGLSLAENITIGETILLNAKTNANLAVSYTSKTTNTCTIQNGKLQAIALGKCSIEATQKGDLKNLAATPVIAETQITPKCTSTQYAEGAECKEKSAQVISDFTLPKNLNIGQSIKLNAKSSANLAITYTSKTENTCEVKADNQLETLSVGTCKVEASQAGNEKVLAAPSITIQTIILPILTNTGLTTCGTDTKNNLSCTADNLKELYGLNQDGEVQAGRKMTYSLVKYSNDECIKDHVTGLTWEQKTDDEGLRHNKWQYIESKETSPIGGGNKYSMCGGTLGNCSTTAYIDALNKTKYCGYSNWRLPTRSEFINIIDYGFTQPAINPIFKNTEYGTKYLTSTPSWGVDFYFGSVNKRSGGPLNIRAVRSAE